MRRTSYRQTGELDVAGTAVVIEWIRTGHVVGIGCELSNESGELGGGGAGLDVDGGGEAERRARRES